jgi:hypothetical protein
VNAEGGQLLFAFTRNGVAMRGVESHHDPVSNSTVQLGHTFGNAWRVENQDAYILTKDSNFNPGLYGLEATHEGRGRRVARLRPGRRAILDTSALVAVLLRVPGSDAALNFGDCLSYATAVIAAESLLCIGDDFAQTDCLLA